MTDGHDTRFSTSVQTVLTQGFAHIVLGGQSHPHSIGIGKTPTANELLDVGINTNIDGKLTLKKTEFSLTINSTNCSSLGSTWAGSNGVCVTVSIIDAKNKVKIASNGTLAIATVPEGYRPRANVYSNCFGYNGLCTIRIESDGTVSIRNQSGAEKAVGTLWAATLTYYI